MNTSGGDATSPGGRQAGASLLNRRLIFSGAFGLWAFLDNQHIRTIVAQKSAGVDRLDIAREYDARLFPSKDPAASFYTTSVDHASGVNPIFLAPRLFDFDGNPIEVDATAFDSMDFLLESIADRSPDLITRRSGISITFPGFVVDDLVGTLKRIVNDTDMKKNRWGLWNQARKRLDQIDAVLRLKK